MTLPFEYLPTTWRLWACACACTCVCHKNQATFTATKGLFDTVYRSGLWKCRVNSRISSYLVFNEIVVISEKFLKTLQYNLSVTTVWIKLCLLLGLQIKCKKLFCVQYISWTWTKYRKFMLIIRILFTNQGWTAASMWGLHLTDLGCQPNSTVTRDMLSPNPETGLPSSRFIRM